MIDKREGDEYLFERIKALLGFTYKYLKQLETREFAAKEIEMAYTIKQIERHLNPDN
jgi:hypothetical protein